MFEHIVVGIGADNTPGEDAVALARQLASPQAELVLVHVVVSAEKPSPDSGAVRDAKRRRQAVEQLTVLAHQLEVSGPVACVEAPSVRRGLHEFAAARHADLLVVSATRSDEVSQLLLGDDATEVLEDAPCPVGVAPGGYAGRDATIHRIGVAYDGSAGSEQALAVARSLAADRHAALSAFEAVAVPRYGEDIWDVRGELDHAVEEVREQIAALGGVEAHAELGDPPDELTRYAQSVDLLVIGAHAHRPLDRLPHQTTSQQLADRTRTPLLVLSPNGSARG